MGQGSVALLPRLDGVAVEHQIAGEDPRASLLARTLTELGIADPRDWQGGVTRYLLNTLDRWITLHGSSAIREQFSLHATLRSNPGLYGSDDIDHARLYLAVEADGAGYVAIGPTVDLLKEVHPQLPVTFYRLLIGALGRWARPYDYQDALERVEMWKEWIEGEENPEQYEFPDVEGCIPAEMRMEPLDTEGLRDLTNGIKDGVVRRLIQAALDLDQVSRQVKPPEISEETREALMDCNPPLPALLVSFRDQDGVVAAFDEDSQAMLEAEPEPSFLAEIVPADAASVRQAFDSLAGLCETLATASRLMTLLPGSQQEVHQRGSAH
jgi:hypothetical protein